LRIIVQIGYEWGIVIQLVKKFKLKLDIMASKVKKQTNSVIDNSKNFQVITHSIYLVANPKTGEIKQECRIEKNQ